MPSMKEILAASGVSKYGEGEKSVVRPAAVVHAPAINKVAINAKAAPINTVVHKVPKVAPRDSGIGPEKVANGRTRAAYNEYMREYMKVDRARKKAAKAASDVNHKEMR